MPPRIAVHLALAAACLGAGARASTPSSTVTLALTPAQPWPRHTIDASSQGADGVKLADANGDGRPDIATGWEEGGSIRLYLNPGPADVRRPWPKVELSRVRSPEDATIVDLDGDGRPDVVSATEGRDRSLYVHWSPAAGAGSAWETSVFAEARGKQAWMFALPFDVDREHGIDLVVGSKLEGAAIGWLRSPRDPRDTAAWTYHALRPAGWIMSLLAADLNRDGFDDILFSDRRGPRAGIGWLENPGAARSATSTWKEHRIADADDTSQVMFIAHADLDGDGTAEIIAPYKKARLAILRRTGPETWQPQWLDLAGELGTAKAVSAGDINSDGRIDLVMSCEEAKGPRTGLVWLEQLPSGWKLHDLGGPAGVKFDLVPLLDLDGDGDLDVITTEEQDQLGVVWYENPFGRKP